MMKTEAKEFDGSTYKKIERQNPKSELPKSTSNTTIYNKDISIFDDYSDTSPEIYRRSNNYVKHTLETWIQNSRTGFEDGYKSILAQLFIEMVTVLGNRAIEVLSMIAFNPQLSKKYSPQLAEILKWLSYESHDENSQNVLQVYRRLLESEDPLLRDVSSLALNDLEDINSISALQIAIDKETISFIKKSMEEIVERMKEHVASQS